jgi:hypothetical protein
VEPGAADERRPPPPPPPEARGGSRRQLFAEAAAPPGHAPAAAAAAATRRPDSWLPSWLTWGEPVPAGHPAASVRRQRSGDEAARVLQARWRARRQARWQEVARRRRQRELILFLAAQVR